MDKKGLSGTKLDIGRKFVKKCRGRRNNLTPFNVPTRYLPEIVHDRCNPLGDKIVYADTKKRPNLFTTETLVVSLIT